MTPNKIKESKPQFLNICGFLSFSLLGRHDRKPYSAGGTQTVLNMLKPLRSVSIPLGFCTPYR